jgi:hypothetical protein
MKKLMFEVVYYVKTFTRIFGQNYSYFGLRLNFSGGFCHNSQVKKKFTYQSSKSSQFSFKKGLRSLPTITVYVKYAAALLSRKKSLAEDSSLPAFGGGNRATKDRIPL